MFGVKELGPGGPEACTSVWAVEAINRSSAVAVKGDIFGIWSLLDFYTNWSNLMFGR